jgi:hypothetical protein
MARLGDARLDLALIRWIAWSSWTTDRAEGVMKSSIDNLSTIAEMRREEEVRQADAWRRHHPATIDGGGPAHQSLSSAAGAAIRRLTARASRTLGRVALRRHRSTA